MTEPVQVLFVCLGNICRSPTAQGVFQSVVAQAGLADQIAVDSCGTGGWHVGKNPDRRAVAAAAGRGIDISQLRARQLTLDDLQHYDYVLVMDRQNLEDVKVLWRQGGGTEPTLFLSYGQADVDEVPDPYYGGDQGFERVIDLIEQASQGLLGDIRDRKR